jgi:tRNA ligase
MEQNAHEVTQLLHALEASKTRGKPKGKKGFSCKKTTFDVEGTQGIQVDSWRFQDWDYKRDDLPTYARGLFTTKKADGSPEICIRGYDKFFNVGEVPSTEWQNIEQDTSGPYELSVKENGCIIFMSGLEDGTLLVCSKHSTGARSDVAESHAKVGEKWVRRHVESMGKTTQDLSRALRDLNATAVAELCDDTFEEHVLEYPPDAAGLYLHGINFNLPEFATLSGPEVHQFADTWGFKKAQYVMIQTIDEVKTFLDSCAETGSWDGRDTEGFVVRCKKRTKYKDSAPDWFFKFKFEEPYLMYRQWRECTKAVIAGKPPKYKKHQKITEAYLLYARRQLAKDSSLAKAYQQNHGIIKMRDGFLAEIGQKGSDIIRQEAADGEGASSVVNNVVLIPIATIGCGKTTVATALVKLFGFGHIQNDNIQGQRGRPARFALGVTNLLAAHKVVIADRNNHQRRERAQIIEDVSKVVPDARFVALHYVHEPKAQMLDDIRRVTRQRVLERGDNHQTIRAETKGQQEIIGIMEGFLERFEGCNSNVDPDSDFEEVINLDPCASSLENLETVVTHLYNVYPGLLPADMPTDEDMQAAIDFALSHEVTTKHDLSFSKPAHGDKANKQPNQAKKVQHQAPPKPLTVEDAVAKLEYFSISLQVSEVNAVLAAMFDHASSEEGWMYRMLKQTRRVQNEFHVTLIHRASASQNRTLWDTYTQEFQKTIGGKELMDRNQMAVALGRARIKLERIVWDDRLMAFVVRIYPADDGGSWTSHNAIPHITVGTAGPEIKPVESNALLARWEAGDTTGKVFYEKEVPGSVILDGVVKPEFQRGFLK